MTSEAAFAVVLWVTVIVGFIVVMAGVDTTVAVGGAPVVVGDLVVVVVAGMGIVVVMAGGETVEAS